MNFTSHRALYYLLRAALALLGLFLVASSLISLFQPGVVHSESSRPSWQVPLLAVAFLLDGSFLLAPFRWLRRAPMLPVALLVFALGVLWAAYAGLSGLVGLAQGKKSWLVLPTSVIFIALSLIAPAALMMRRRLAS